MPERLTNQFAQFTRVGVQRGLQLRILRRGREVLQHGDQQDHIEDKEKQQARIVALVRRCPGLLRLSFQWSREHQSAQWRRPGTSVRSNATTDHANFQHAKPVCRALARRLAHQRRQVGHAQEEQEDRQVADQRTDRLPCRATRRLEQQQQFRGTFAYRPKFNIAHLNVKHVRIKQQQLKFLQY